MGESLRPSPTAARAGSNNGKYGFYGSNGKKRIDLIRFSVNVRFRLAPQLLSPDYGALAHLLQLVARHDLTASGTTARVIANPDRFY
jgi:hypothetical protein